MILGAVIDLACTNLVIGKTRFKDEERVGNDYHDHRAAMLILRSGLNRRACGSGPMPHQGSEEISKERKSFPLCNWSAGCY